MLSKFYNIYDIRTYLLSQKDYRPYPTIEERSSWGELSKDVKDYLVAQAERYIDYKWPKLTAQMYMTYSRIGNRRIYEEPYHDRRRALTCLVIGECIENKGRFLGDILDGIWFICEESSWVTPSHIHMLPEGAKNDIFIDQDTPFIDLFAAETGSMLASIYYLLKTSLETISPKITNRIIYEVNKRILEPYLERNDFWWMGLNDESKLNNWTPWCTSNCLNAFLLLEKDQTKRILAVQKSLESMDHFLKTYHPDGACDEGPSYWNKAGGSLFDYLELLNSSTNGAINVYSKSLIQNIASYIYKVHIHDDYFVNVGDGSHKVVVEGGLLYRFGERIQDEQLKALGVNTQHKWGPEMIIKMKFLSFMRIMPHLFEYQKIEESKLDTHIEKDIWMKDTQLMLSRETNRTDTGLLVAFKGGHNNESHNHNDVGNVILYAEGQPVLIDIGVETYNAKTFSDERYSIWTMQSAYHNVPTVNSIQQKNGDEYRATHLHYQAEPDGSSLSMNLGEAYPEEASIELLNRECYLKRGPQPSFQITDHIKFTQDYHAIEFNFMTCQLPELKENGIMIIPFKQDKAVQMNYDIDKIEATYEQIKIHDQKLKQEWGEYLYRICLQSTQHKQENKYAFKFKTINI